MHMCMRKGGTGFSLSAAWRQAECCCLTRLPVQGLEGRGLPFATNAGAGTACRVQRPQTCTAASGLPCCPLLHQAEDKTLSMRPQCRHPLSAAVAGLQQLAQAYWAPWKLRDGHWNLYGEMEARIGVATWQQQTESIAVVAVRCAGFEQ